jgi:hypothetical protein
MNNEECARIPENRTGAETPNTSDAEITGDVGLSRGDAEELTERAL